MLGDLLILRKVCFWVFGFRIFSKRKKQGIDFEISVKDHELVQ